MNNIEIYDMNDNKLLNMFQWDSNQVLKITNIDNTENLMVHFWNKLSPTAYVVAPTVVDEHTITVAVPNILLQHAETIMVYLYATTGTESYKTTDDIKIPVKARPVPSDYEYVENIEYISINLLNQKYNELKEEVDELAKNTVIYSTDEHEVGTWLDGRKVYEKTYIFEIENKDKDEYEIILENSEILDCVDIKTHLISSGHNAMSNGTLITEEQDVQQKIYDLIPVYVHRRPEGYSNDGLAIIFSLSEVGAYLWPAPYKIYITIRYIKPITQNQLTITNDEGVEKGSYLYYIFDYNFGLEIGDVWHASVLNPSGVEVMSEDLTVEAGAGNLEGYNVLIYRDADNNEEKAWFVDNARFTYLDSDPILLPDNVGTFKWYMGKGGDDNTYTLNVHKLLTNEEE